MSKVWGYVACVAVGALGGGALWYLKPRIETKVEVKTVEVIRTVRVRDQEVHKTTHLYPDGHSVVVEDSHTKTDTKRDETETGSSSTTTKPVDRNWRVGVLVGSETKWPLVPVYGAQAERRLFGPVVVGAWGLTNGTVGLSAGLEF